jgi:hypothetical protein
MLRMPGELATSIDLTSLPTEAAALIARLQQQAQAHAQELARRDREIAWRDAKIDKLNFEVARLRRWKFDAKTEAMTASQRLLFAETLIEDEASLRALLAELQPLRRPPAVLPARTHQRTLGRAHAALDAGHLGRRRRRGARAAVRVAPALHPQLPGAARRRDARAAAGPGRAQDEEGLRLGLGAQPPRPAPGRGL